MKEINLTQGAIFQKLIRFSLPMIAGNLLQLFVDAGEIEIIAEGTRYLRIEGAMYVGIGVLFLWYGYFRGISKPHISQLLTVISLGTRVILSYTLAPYTLLGVAAIWCSIPIGWVLADVIGLYLYRKKQNESEFERRKSYEYNRDLSKQKKNKISHIRNRAFGD